MNTVDRAERIKELAEVAISILRQHDPGGYIDAPGGGRLRALDHRCGQFRLSFRRRVDDDERLARLEIKFEGERVLFASWTVDGFTRRSYSPGPWENLLRRCDRFPAPKRE